METALVSPRGKIFYVYIPELVDRDMSGFINQNHGWRKAQVEDGKILWAGGVGYDSVVAATRALWPAIQEAIEAIEPDSLAGVDLQGLHLSALLEHHKFRIAWGDDNPDGKYTKYPNGVETSLTLYHKGYPVERFVLPTGWWDMTDEEQEEWMD